ncbi:unnamed protein product [Acanthoscelides obtectus]|uniref:Uncharacterized protein n=1 Tax=Acanthoscelides obtectus TaxID=200917 RepID=A0A9P0NTK4_ACAOB|nr:unnamed protein product [Acanthoscelides obtectus]CAK1671165.1 hypothetical protein AOBTE_LOCUS28104 [Acanthoscelides obtectus]
MSTFDELLKLLEKDLKKQDSLAIILLNFLRFYLIVNVGHHFGIHFIKIYFGWCSAFWRGCQILFVPLTVIIKLCHCSHTVVFVCRFIRCRGVIFGVFFSLFSRDAFVCSIRVFI